MLIQLANRVRSFRFTGTSQLLRLGVDVAEVPHSQRLLASEGSTDVVLGTLIQPLGAKYPALCLGRWVDALGRVQGDEFRVEFASQDFYPPSSVTAGFELYIKPGTRLNVSVLNGGGSVDFEDFYTKAEVDALISGKASLGDAYTKSASDSLLLLKADKATTYTQSQVNTLIPTTFRSFDYESATQPSSPQNGKTWRERDGSNNLITDWVYSSTYSAWLSIEVHKLGFINPGITAIANFFSSGTAYYTGYALRLLTLTTSHSPQSPNSSSAYWTWQLRAFAASTAYGSVGSSQNLTPGSVYHSSIALTDLIATTANNAFSITVDKIGTPGTFYSEHTLRYRYQRP